MKINPLSAVNFFGLLALGAGLFFLQGPSKTRAEAPQRAWLAELEQQPEAEEREGLSLELASLRTRVAELEARLKKREAVPARLPAPASSPAAVAPGAAAPSAELEGEAVPVKRAEVAALVKDQLEAELAARRKREEEERKARQAQRRQGKPRKTVAELGRELNLTPTQETGIRDALSGLTREAIQILFQAEGDTGLAAVKEQLRLAQFDPALKEQLRQKVTLNYTLHAAEVSALSVKLDSNLRKLVEPEQLGKIYQYDVKPANPEFPDLREFFWGQSTNEQKQGN